MIEMSVSVAVLIGAFCLGRALWKKKLSARLMYACWLIVAVRLLFPWQLPLDTGVQTVRIAELPETAEFTLPAVQPTENAAPVRVEIPVKSTVRAVWLLGCGAVFLCFGLSRQKLSRELKRGSVRLTAASPLPVYATPHAAAPCFFGTFRPVIYVPEAAVADEKALACILAHEEAHARQKDGIWSLLRVVCLGVWWFHPLVWLAAALSQRDAELSCDERALQTLGKEQTVTYGEVLLDLMSRSVSRRAFLFHSMADSPNTLKGRLEAMIHPRKTAPLCAAALLLILTLAVGCTAVKASAPKKTQIEFPAITSEIETPAFTASLTLPEGWRVQESDGDIELYKGDERMGVIGADNYPYYAEGEAPEPLSDNYYQVVYASIRLGSLCYWDIESPAFKRTEHGETALATVEYAVDPGDNTPAAWWEHKQLRGIVSYNDKLHVYVTVSLSEGVDEETQKSIAESLTVG